MRLSLRTSSSLPRSSVTCSEDFCNSPSSERVRVSIALVAAIRSSTSLRMSAGDWPASSSPRGGGQRVGIGVGVAGGGLQLDQHRVDHLAHAGADIVHRAGGARAGQAAQAQVGEEFGGEGLLAGDHRRRSPG